MDYVNENDSFTKKIRSKSNITNLHEWSRDMVTWSRFRLCSVNGDRFWNAMILSQWMIQLTAHLRRVNNALNSHFHTKLLNDFMIAYKPYRLFFMIMSPFWICKASVFLHYNCMEKNDLHFFFFFLISFCVSQKVKQVSYNEGDEIITVFPFFTELIL